MKGCSFASMAMLEDSDEEDVGDVCCSNDTVPSVGSNRDTDMETAEMEQ